MVKGLARFPYVEPKPAERTRVSETAAPDAGPEPLTANEPPSQA